MKSWIALVSVAALAACSQTEPSTGADPTEAATPLPAITPGLYDFTNVEGANNRAELKTDGRYTTYGEDGAVLTGGSWTNTGRRSCFDPDGDTPEVCYNASPPAEDGSFIGTNDAGATITVRPVADGSGNASGS